NQRAVAALVQADRRMGRAYFDGAVEALERVEKLEPLGKVEKIKIDGLLSRAKANNKLARKVRESHLDEADKAANIGDVKLMEENLEKALAIRTNVVSERERGLWSRAEALRAARDIEREFGITVPAGGEKQKALPDHIVKALENRL